MGSGGEWPVQKLGCFAISGMFDAVLKEMLLALEITLSVGFLLQAPIVSSLTSYMIGVCRERLLKSSTDPQGAEDGEDLVGDHCPCQREDTC